MQCFIKFENAEFVTHHTMPSNYVDMILYNTVHAHLSNRANCESGISSHHSFPSHLRADFHSLLK